MDAWQITWPPGGQIDTYAQKSSGLSISFDIEPLL